MLAMVLILSGSAVILMLLFCSFVRLNPLYVILVHMWIFFLLTMNPLCMQLVRTCASCAYASLNVLGMPRMSSVDFSILSVLAMIMSLVV